MFFFWIKLLKRIQSWLGLGLITLTKVVTGLALIKYLSYTFGPEAFGKLGQLMTVVAITSMFAGGGTSNGLIKLLAAAEDEKERVAYLSAAFSIYLVTSCVLSLMLIAWSLSDLSLPVLGLQELSWASGLLALSLWLVGAYNICQAIFSAYQKLRLFILVNIAGPLLGTCLLFVLLYVFHFAGAAYGIVLLPACGGLVALLLLPQLKKIPWKDLRFNIKSREIKTLLSYSFLMLVAASSVSIAQLLVRDLLAEKLGWQTVGYWFGVVKISDVYMQFIGMLLANYAMPIFSSVKTLYDLQTEIKKVLFPLASCATLALLIFYQFRVGAITLFFSGDFTPMDPLFLPQFIGDYLRIIFSIMVYVFLARGHRLLPLLGELFQGLGLFLFSYALLTPFGLMAPLYAHVVVYTLLLLSMVIAYYFLRQGWFIQNKERVLINGNSNNAINPIVEGPFGGFNLVKKAQ